MTAGNRYAVRGMARVGRVAKIARTVGSWASGSPRLLGSHQGLPDRPTRPEAVRVSVPVPPSPDHDDRPFDGILADALRRQGLDELSVAETLTWPIVEVANAVRESRAIDPATFPGYIGRGDPESVARMILGTLLDIGWTPPGVAA